MCSIQSVSQSKYTYYAVCESKESTSTRIPRLGICLLGYVSNSYCTFSARTKPVLVNGRAEQDE
jgi:hypothetical protein